MKSSKYVAPRLSTRGPKWHQINFGKILAHALAFRTDIRCNAAQLLVMIKKLDMDNKKQSVYEEKLKSANDRREKLLIEIEKQKELVNAHRAGTMSKFIVIVIDSLMQMYFN